MRSLPPAMVGGLSRVSHAGHSERRLCSAVRGSPSLRRAGIRGCQARDCHCWPGTTHRVHPLNARAWAAAAARRRVACIATSWTGTMFVARNLPRAALSPSTRMVMIALAASAGVHVAHLWVPSTALQPWCWSVLSGAHADHKVTRTGSTRADHRAARTHVSGRGVRGTLSSAPPRISRGRRGRAV